MSGGTFALIIVIILLVLFIGVVIYYLVKTYSSNNGSPCKSNSDCHGGTTCDSFTKVCRTKIGDSCTSTSQCITGTGCITGKCLPLRLAPQVQVGPNKPPAIIPPPEIINPPPVVTPPVVEPPVVPPVVTPPAIPPVIPPPAVSHVTSTAVPYYPVQYVGEAPIDVHSPNSEVMSYIDGLHSSGESSTGCSRDYSVKSGESTVAYSSTDPSTPYLKSEGQYFCKSTSVGGLSLIPLELSTRPGRGVVDVISYSNMVIFLHENGRITKEQSGSRHYVRCNVKPTRLEKHAGYLYSVVGGMLYKLNNTTLSNNTLWTWRSCSWSPAGITHTSSTLDGKYLWLQVSNKGMLYDSDMQMIQAFDMGSLKRRYGQNHTEYLDYDPNTCTATLVKGSESETYDGICAGLITQNGELVTLNHDDARRYVDVKLVNWVPYFISISGMTYA